MKNEKWDDVHGNTSPDDRMVAFLESPTDSYAILQLREDVDDNIPLMFANYSYLQKIEMEPEIDRYEVVYHGSISVSEDVDRQLEDLYVKFNIDHPNDFRGHSMSVSDIVALKVAGEVSFHYVDSVGFQKLENFMKSENYLKNAEMAMEDDYGMIDGRDEIALPIVAAAPTVDAVVVTRCKDCRNHRELNRKDRLESGYAEGVLWCMNRSDGVWADGFCSDGEPKEV